MFDRAARRILEELGNRLPDLSAATLLLPHLHAAGPLAASMARLSGHPVIIPPCIFTLADWSEAAPISTQISSDSSRQSKLFQALKSRRWFDETDLWPLTRQLLTLFDELTLNRVGLPESVARFTDELARAYHARANQPLQFEARLVHEMWFAMAHNEIPDRASRHGMGLAWQAEHASGPIFTLGLTRMARMEQAALERAAERVPVIALSPHSLDEPITQALHAAWPDSLDQPLMARADAIKNGLPSNPLAGRVKLFGARSLEEEAEAAALQIRLWLNEGCGRIGLIAQDRLAARRVRALLERVQIRVRDETGWQLSTTSAASMIMTWVQVVTHKFRFESVLTLLKSPLVFTHDASPRNAACRQMEKALIAHGPAAGKAELAQRLNRAERDESVDEARHVLDTLVDAARLLEGGTRSLSGWLTALMQSLGLLGTHLETDAAGVQLLALFRQRSEELKSDREKFNLPEFRRWLDGELEVATFVEPHVDSPVIFTHLAGARLRPFDGVILLGAEADRLPGMAPAGFFNQRVRAELGLPSHADLINETQAHLISILQDSAKTLVIWRAREAGEDVPVSPWFERLDSLSKLAWDQSLQNDVLRHWLGGMAARPSAGGTPAPAPSAASVPTRVSVSAYNSLIACPYQYFARHVLKLNEEDEITAEVDKADYGTLVHQILLRFHQRHPLLTSVSDETLMTDLLQETRRAFASPEGQDWFSQAWRLRWESRISPYIEWQKKREADGWRWQEGELKSSRDFPLQNGGMLTLYGRLDRIDRHGEELAVLDYKTESTQTLKDKSKGDGEDVQLAAYALLMGDRVREAAFVSLEEKNGIKTLPASSLDSEAEAQRLTASFEELHQGMPLHAQGIEKVCSRCEMRGLCRRDYWPDEDSDG